MIGNKDQLLVDQNKLLLEQNKIIDRLMRENKEQSMKLKSEAVAQIAQAKLKAGLDYTEQNKVITRLMEENKEQKMKYENAKKETEINASKLKKLQEENFLNTTQSLDAKTKECKETSEEVLQTKEELKHKQLKVEELEKENWTLRKACDIKDRETKITSLEVHKLHSKLDALQDSSINSSARGQHIQKIQKNLLNSKMTSSNPGSLSNSRCNSSYTSPNQSPGKQRLSSDFSNSQSSHIMMKALSITVDENDEFQTYTYNPDAI